jgi:hypothetical protein
MKKRLSLALSAVALVLVRPAGLVTGTPNSAAEWINYGCPGSVETSGETAGRLVSGTYNGVVSVSLRRVTRSQCARKQTQVFTFSWRVFVWNPRNGVWEWKCACGLRSVRLPPGYRRTSIAPQARHALGRDIYFEYMFTWRTAAGHELGAAISTQAQASDYRCQSWCTVRWDASHGLAYIHFPGGPHPS